MDNKHNDKCNCLSIPPDPCVRELIDCLSRYGVRVISGDCGHRGSGYLVLCENAIERTDGGWKLNLAPILDRDLHANWSSEKERRSTQDKIYNLIEKYQKENKNV